MHRARPSGPPGRSHEASGGFHHSRAATYFFRPLQAVIVDEPLVAHARLLHDPPGADVLRHDYRHDGGKADRPRPWPITAIAASVAYPLFQLARV